MTNLLEVLKWRICGSYDPEGPVTEDGPDRARNRAKYEAWKYNTFGPGRNIFRKELAYQIIDSDELHGEPLLVNDPREIASLACIIAEMEGHQYVAMLTPVGILKTKEDVEREEDTAIDRVVCYRIPDNLPPVKYTEWHESRDEKNEWGMPKCYPMLHVIEQDASKCRENLRRELKEMLETLKQYNNPQTEK